MKKIFFIIVSLGILVVLSSCLATDDILLQSAAPSGFLMGIWHGWIAPFALVLGLFVDGVRIYSPYNTGWWYDAGFYMAIISGFGGLSFMRKNRNRDR